MGQEVLSHLSLNQRHRITVETILLIIISSIVALFTQYFTSYLFYLSLSFFLANPASIYRKESTPPTPEMPSTLHLVLFWKEIVLTALNLLIIHAPALVKRLQASALLSRPVSTWPFGDSLGAQPGCSSSPDSCFPNPLCCW